MNRLTKMLTTERSLSYRREDRGGGLDLLIYYNIWAEEWVFCPVMWIVQSDGSTELLPYEEYRTGCISNAASTLHLIVGDARKVRYLR